MNTLISAATALVVSLMIVVPLVASPEKTAPNSPKANVHAPAEADGKACEEIVRAILKAEDREPAVLKKFYTPKFGATLIKATTGTDEDPLPVLDYNFIYETQDELPKVTTVGPAVASDGGISVAVVMVHKGEKPFKKTWVFEKSDETWMACDIVTSGRESGNGSLAKELGKMR